MDLLFYEMYIGMSHVSVYKSDVKKCVPVIYYSILFFILKMKRLMSGRIMNNSN